MMTDSKHGRLSFIRLVAIVPVVAVMVMAFGAVRAESIKVVKEVVVEQEQMQPDTPLIKADVMPKFEGKDLSAFIMWVSQQLNYPAEWVEEGLSGRVIVEFIVDKEGNIDKDAIKVLATPDERLSNEVIRVVGLSPRWTPGQHEGKPVNIKFTMPVNFALPTK